MKTVVIFGVFDRVHEGHKVFIDQAKKIGDVLIAIVARDSAVERLKGRKPFHDEQARIQALLEIPEIDRVYLGDADEGSYSMLKELAPDIVYLGYDQEDLGTDIQKAIDAGRLPMIELRKGTAFHPEIYKSSILNQLYESTN